MNYLERLDIHPQVQSFFKPYFTNSGGTVIFKYGRSIEHASPNFHQVPFTEEIWTAGEADIATTIFICGSAMDAIAWLNLNHKRYSPLQNLCFISTGSVPHKSQAEIIQQPMPKRKLHFIFSSDHLGAICDLKLASFIRNKPIKISYHHHQFIIIFENRSYAFEKLSLNGLEKASGYNFKIRTHKPNNASTYYEQHRNRHPA